MVRESNREGGNSFIIEYSACPGTLRSKPLELTDEPWTKNSAGRGGSPAFGARSRLRNIHSGTSPFFVQYSLLQIAPVSDDAAPGLCAEAAPANPATTPAPRPRPAPLMTARRASG